MLKIKHLDRALRQEARDAELRAAGNLPLDSVRTEFGKVDTLGRVLRMQALLGDGRDDGQGPCEATLRMHREANPPPVGQTPKMTFRFRTDPETGEPLSP